MDGKLYWVAILVRLHLCILAVATFQQAKQSRGILSPITVIGRPPPQNNQKPTIKPPETDSNHGNASPQLTSNSEYSPANWSQVCYHDGQTDLGCFENENGVCAPRANSIRPFYVDVPPLNPDFVNTKFVLHYWHDEEQEVKRREISYNDPESLIGVLSGGSRNCLKAITHGWRVYDMSPWIHRVADKLVTCQGCPTIEVNWYSRGIGSYDAYFIANANTRLVGRQLGILLERIASAAGRNLCDLLERTELIGHSLGVHVMGRAAYYLKSRDSSCKIGKMFFLDAAAPYNENQNTGELSSPVCRADETDAQCSRAFHTTIRPKIFLDQTSIGIKAPIAKYDIYPNGGSDHPSCALVPIPRKYHCWHAFAHVMYEDYICTQECNYTVRGYDQDTGVLSPTGSYAIKDMCPDSSPSGGSIPGGSYYLETSITESYCTSEEHSN